MLIRAVVSFHLDAFGYIDDPLSSGRLNNCNKLMIIIMVLTSKYDDF